MYWWWGKGELLSRGILRSPSSASREVVPPSPARSKILISSPTPALLLATSIASSIIPKRIISVFSFSIISTEISTVLCHMAKLTAAPTIHISPAFTGDMPRTIAPVANDRLGGGSWRLLARHRERCDSARQSL